MCKSDENIKECKTSFPLLSSFYINITAGMAQSVKRLSTTWKVRGLYPGGVRFSMPFTPVSRSTQPPVQGVPALSWGLVGRQVLLTTHLLLGPGCEWFGGLLTPPLCACFGISLGDLYLYRVH
jgi:hypothetical protein